MPNTMNKIAPKDQIDFLDIAVSQGVDAAVAKHGNIITASEAAALKTLSQVELTELRDIQTKIIKFRAGPNPHAMMANGWTCVNVAC